jgi:protein ImuB
MRRVVSLFLPHWSTDRVRRKMSAKSPESTGPLVTVIPDHGRRIIAAVDAEAKRTGLAPGMTLTKARSLVPDLQAIEADPEADFAGLRNLTLWAGRRYSPIVAPDPPDGIWIDITGCAALFGSETALVKDLHRRVGAFGLHLQIAVADTAGCAHAAARHVPAGRPVTIERGKARQAMALLPIGALRLEPGVVEALRKLGFERVEQLLGEPRGPFAKRFGRNLYRRLDQALGLVHEPIEPIFPETQPCARRGLLEPIGTAEAFAQVIGDLVDDLVLQLTAAGKGARRLDCYFHRIDGITQAVRVGAATATRDPLHLAKLLTARLETIDPGLGVEAMTLVAPLVDPMAPRQGYALDDHSRRGPDLATLVDTLANRFGSRRLYREAPQPSAMPERSTRRDAPLSPASGTAWSLDHPRPSRMLMPPEPVQVTAMLPDHPPAMFVWRGKRHRVARADGPERLHGEWWREAGHEAESPYALRDYFQVETTTGARYWLFRLGDGENPATGPMRWFVHGAFA